MLAIFKDGGKQYLVQKNDIVYLEKKEIKEGKEITFTDVLYYNGKVGTPTILKAKVIGVVEKHGKEKKVIVFKYKPKKNSKSKYGHRQPYTRVKIKDIKLG